MGSASPERSVRLKHGLFPWFWKEVEESNLLVLRTLGDSWPFLAYFRPGGCFILLRRLLEGKSKFFGRVSYAKSLLEASLNIPFHGKASYFG